MCQEVCLMRALANEPPEEDVDDFEDMDDEDLELAPA